MDNHTANPRAHHTIFRQSEKWQLPQQLCPRWLLPPTFFPSVHAAHTCELCLWNWTQPSAHWIYPAEMLLSVKTEQTWVPAEASYIYRLCEDTSACQLGEAAPELVSHHDAAYVSTLGARLGISALHSFAPHKLIWRNYLHPFKICFKIYISLYSKIKIRHDHLYYIN